MYCEDNSKQDNEHFLKSLHFLNDLEFQQFSILEKEQLRDLLEELIPLSKDLVDRGIYYRQKCIDLEEEVRRLDHVNSKLEKDNEMLVMEYENVCQMITDLQQSKQMKIHEISLSSEELQNTCLEMSTELQSQKNKNNELINNQKQLFKKIYELEDLEEMSRKHIKISQIEEENHVLRKKCSEFKSRLINMEGDFDLMREENLKLKEDQFELEQKIQEQTYLLEHFEETQYTPNNLQDIFQPSFQDQPELLKNVSSEGLYKGTPTLKKQSSQSTFIRGRRSTVEMHPKQSHFKSHLNCKYSTHKKTQKSISIKHSESEISLFDGIKVIQNKYQKDVKLLKRENKRLKNKYRQLENEMLLKMDSITQLQGQLQIRQDKNDQASIQLEIVKANLNQIRKENYLEKIILEKSYSQLEESYKQLSQNYNQLLEEHEELKEAFQKTNSSISKQIQSQCQLYLNSYLVKEESQAKSYLKSLIEEKKKQKQIKRKQFKFNSLDPVTVFNPIPKTESSAQVKPMTQQSCSQSIVAITEEKSTQVFVFKSDEQSQTVCEKRQTECQIIPMTQTVNVQIFPLVQHNQCQIQTQTFSQGCQISAQTITQGCQISAQTITQECQVSSTIVQGATQTNLVNLEEKGCSVISQICQNGCQTETKVFQDACVGLSKNFLDQGTNTERMVKDGMCQTMNEKKSVNFGGLSEMSFQNELISLCQSEWNHDTAKICLTQRTGTKNTKTVLKNSMFLPSNSPENVSKIKDHSTMISPQSSREKLTSRVRRDDEKQSRLLNLIDQQPVEQSYNFSSKYFSSFNNEKQFQSMKEIQMEEIKQAEPEPKEEKKERPKKKIICPQVLTEKQSNFLTLFIHHDVAFDENVRNERWKPGKLYICECKSFQEDKEEKLACWDTGLASLSEFKAVTMRKRKREIADKKMRILGNSEIRLEEDRIESRRMGKKNYFQGNLGDSKWKVERFVAYTLS